MQKPFDDLMNRYQELSDLNGAMALLAWDQETYMPEGAQEARGRQMAALSAIAHAKFTTQEMGELLERLQTTDAPEEEDERIAVERVAWEYERETKVSERWVREMARAQSDSVACWARSRQENDFASFLPHLDRILELRREQAELLRRGNQTLYEALLDGYERGASEAGISSLFDDVKQRIIPLVQRIANEGDALDDGFLHGHFDPDRQWEVGVEVLRAMGFDFHRGRQDRSAHPFTSGFHPTDVRLTTRIDPEHFSPGFFSSMHEGGHGLYEQGIRPEDWQTPLGNSISLAIHESQSRLWENLVGRGMPFWRHFFGRLRDCFPENLRDIPLDAFYRAINVVRPSLIRVNADEVTYSLHIILRYEIERELLSGAIRTVDLPEIWRTRMREYLSIEVPSDREGCLQDIHWAWGMIGYFPTYNLGNLYSVQFFEQAGKDIPDLEERISNGNLSVLTEWLRENIHRVGQRCLARELCRQLTGGDLSAEPFVRYLETKFSRIYRLG